MPGAARVVTTKLDPCDCGAQSFKTDLPRSRILGPVREIRRFIRFAYNLNPAYGFLTNDAVEELKGPPFQSVEPTGRSFPLAYAIALPAET